MGVAAVSRQPIRTRGLQGAGARAGDPNPQAGTELRLAAGAAAWKAATAGGEGQVGGRERE